MPVCRPDAPPSSHYFMSAEEESLIKIIGLRATLFVAFLPAGQLNALYCKQSTGKLASQRCAKLTVVPLSDELAIGSCCQYY